MTKVVAISRAMGAEGERIGRLVAERLGYRYVDEEIITNAAEKQGVDPAAIADAERRKGVLLRVLEGLGQTGAASATATPGGPMWIPDDSSELVRSHDLRALIRETVVETASTGDVVIVAHAASFALSDRDDVLRVLITAPPQLRTARLAEARGVDRGEAEKELRRSDEARASYLKSFCPRTTTCSYTRRTWTEGRRPRSSSTRRRSEPAAYGTTENPSTDTSSSSDAGLASPRTSIRSVCRPSDSPVNERTTPNAGWAA